jgi:hypothetical protein
MYNLDYPLKNGFLREAKMNETDVIIEYSRRYEFAKIRQYIAAPLLLISGSGLWISRGAFTSAGEKLFLIISAVAFIASLALALLSIERYRCPYCAKNLGVVRKIKFCPYCGVNLQPVSGSDPAFSAKAPEGRRGRLGGIGANIIPAGGISRSAASRNLSQGTYRPLASDFPEETYPKDIRMFTTRDETELTKRYFRLIAKDDSPPAEEVPAFVPEDPPLMGRREDSGTPGDWRNKAKKERNKSIQK